MKGIKSRIRERKFLRWVLLFSNWVFQGIKGADNTERYYKILFTLLASGVVYGVLSLLIGSLLVRLIASFFVGHTFNWIINGSISTLLIHRLYLGRLSKEKAFSYLFELAERLKAREYIKSCAVFGSISRGELKSSSDIDICFVREPGFFNAIRAIAFMVIEKFRTNVRFIPIEPFLADSVEYMKERYRNDEIPVAVKNKSHKLEDEYNEILTIQQAKKNN